MLNAVIAFSLKNRMLIVLMAIAVVVGGSWQLGRAPLDVFPDLNRPIVSIMTEAPGLAPEEVELLVTRPMEFLLNGATGVRRVRSASSIGLSIVWVEFDWGTDIYRDRQIVAEKLQLVRERLPNNVNPILAPISSIMGEIMLLGLRPATPRVDDEAAAAQAIELRSLAEFDLRNRLLAVEGVAQVTVMGGTLKQYQVITSPERLASQNITLQQLLDATAKANVLTGAGIMVRSPRESLIRISGQSLSLEDLRETPVLWRSPRTVLVKDVADVRFSGPIRRGDGGVWVKDGDRVEGGSAVMLAIQKQPHANTLQLDGAIDNILDQLAEEHPETRIERRIFRQADFIRAAVNNVVEAVRDGALWVVVVLFLFLWNFRTSVSSLTAMPLSILLTVLIFHWLDVSINTMTLGGIAIAIGDLVDDSIVDIENIYRRLKLNRQQLVPDDPLRVVYLASAEVRNSIVYATLIVILAVFPLFSMAGLEGRMFAPMGFAYIVSLLSSLAVSLTITPVLGSLLLPNARFLDDAGDPFLLRKLKQIAEPILFWTLRNAYSVLAVVAVAVTISTASIFWMGGEFLPAFNEGTLTITLQTEPGTSLEESRRVARRAEEMLLEVPEVVAVARRTGRAELDEHAEGVNTSEIDVRLTERDRPKAGWLAAAARAIPFVHEWGVENSGRPRVTVTDDIRDRLANLPNIKVNVGQPISHRLDHIMSGVRAQIAVKVFGKDLADLRNIAADVQTRMISVAGIVDLQIEPQVEISQLKLRVKRREAARYGLAPGDVATLLDTAYKGRVVSQILDEDRYFGLVVWYDEKSRSDPAEIAKTVLDTPSGRRVPLGQVADVIDATGPNTINREHVERRVVVSANVGGRDLASVVADVRAALAPIEQNLRQRSGGYRLEYGGQFEAQQEANLRLLILGAAAIGGIFLLLSKCLESWRAALQVMINVPLAAFGSVVALLLVNRPSWSTLAAAPWYAWPHLWAETTTLSVAHWVGFITLVGIVSRNGIMMISHYQHLLKYEGEPFSAAIIVRGTLERLAPVMMTAFTSFIGLLPLLFGGDQTGKEILYPIAVVVFGGMIASTLLDQLVTPALFFKFGSRAFAPSVPAGRDDIAESIKRNLSFAKKTVRGSI